MDEAKRLSEAQLEELQGRHGKVGVVDRSGHQVVFRKPSRADAQEYRRQVSSEAEKHLAMESLSQKLVIAFDGIVDVNNARTAYTTSFLEEEPFFVNHPTTINVLGWLTGMVADEDALDLGKGALCRSARLQSMRAASQSGSGTAASTPN